MLMEVIGFEPKQAESQVGRLWVTGPDRSRSYFSTKARYPVAQTQTAAACDEYARDHLMGTRLGFAALAWGRDPSRFTLRDARTAPDGKTVVVELAPNSTPDRRRFPVNAGTMFDTTSWSYVHDMYLGFCELTIETATHCILREVDHGNDGQVFCEIDLGDWRDIGEGRAVPQQLHFRFPGQKFTVEDVFKWRSEGLWMLETGSSWFDGKEADTQRESLADLTFDAPTPVLDTALDRATKGAAALDSPPHAAARPSTVTTGAFLLGVKALLAPDAPGGFESLAFSLRGKRTDLIAVVARRADAPAPPAGAALLLVLYDDAGRPVGAAAAPVGAGQDPITLDLGASFAQGAARAWSLTLRSIDGARLIPPRGDGSRAGTGVAARSRPGRRRATLRRGEGRKPAPLVPAHERRRGWSGSDRRADRP
jgi:hypothetical protein